jgi:hypothetical protein
VDGTAGGLGTRQFGDCHVEDPFHDWDYLHRTYCVSGQSSVTVPLRAPPRVTSAPGVLAVLALRRADGTEPTRVELAIGGERVGEVPLDGTWKEHRFELRSERLAAGHVDARLTAADPQARIALDHLLLLPRGQEAVAQRR